MTHSNWWFKKIKKSGLSFEIWISCMYRVVDDLMLEISLPGPIWQLLSAIICQILFGSWQWLPGDIGDGLLYLLIIDPPVLKGQKYNWKYVFEAIKCRPLEIRTLYISKLF